MRLAQFVTLFAFATSTVHAASIPDTKAVSLLVSHAENVPRSEDIISSNTLKRRKGGGGKGGGGGGGGGGKSGGGGGGNSRSSPSSKTGGSTKSGSGAPRAYGGGYYGGGATVPYSAGGKTPKGRSPGLLLLPVAALAIFPGLWLWSVYPYHLNPYRFRNYTDNITNPVNETLPVTCLCQDYSVCGCDDNDDPKYLNDLVGNGSYAALNKTLVTVAMVNNTRTLVLNGTLPNGTTAPGGTDDSAAIKLGFGKYSGYWAMVMIVLYGVILL